MGALDFRQSAIRRGAIKMGLGGMKPIANDEEALYRAGMTHTQPGKIDLPATEKGILGKIMDFKGLADPDVQMPDVTDVLNYRGVGQQADTYTPFASPTPQTATPAAGPQAAPIAAVSPTATPTAPALAGPSALSIMADADTKALIDQGKAAPAPGNYIKDVASGKVLSLAGSAPPLAGPIGATAAPLAATNYDAALREKNLEHDRQTALARIVQTDTDSGYMRRAIDQMGATLHTDEKGKAARAMLAGQLAQADKQRLITETGDVEKRFAGAKEAGRYPEALAMTQGKTAADIAKSQTEGVENIAQAKALDFARSPEGQRQALAMHQTTAKGKEKDAGPTVDQMNTELKGRMAIPSESNRKILQSHYAATTAYEQGIADFVNKVDPDNKRGMLKQITDSLALEDKDVPAGVPLVFRQRYGKPKAFPHDKLEKDTSGLGAAS